MLTKVNTDLFENQRNCDIDAQQGDLLDVYATIAEYELEGELVPIIKKLSNDFEDDQRWAFYRKIGVETFRLIGEWFTKKINTEFSSAVKECFYFTISREYTVKYDFEAQAWLGAEMLYRLRVQA